jgi:hypothetical protein
VTDVFEEVEESLRQEKAAKAWKRASPFVFGGVALIIGAVAVFEYVKYSRNQAIEASAKSFLTATKSLQSGDLAAARLALEPLAKGEGGYALVSGHLLAEVDRQLGSEPTIVAAHLDAVDAKDEGLLGDLARLKSGYIQADTLDLPALEALLSPLLEGGGNTGALARELIAAKALSTGDVERARKEYQALTLELDAPQEMKRRVQQALVVLPPGETSEAAAGGADATGQTKP